VQHAKAYAMLGIRSALVPMLTVTSRFMPWIIMAGILMLQTTPLPLMFGIGLFALTTVFSFVTLPVEFDASRRALVWMEERHIVTSAELEMSRDALWWAASTYVIAAISSLVTLIYYISILNGRRR
jgi:Zn-dependent membrane protease YugP